MLPGLFLIALLQATTEAVLQAEASAFIAVSPAVLRNAHDGHGGTRRPKTILFLFVWRRESVAQRLSALNILVN
jgi:hypothetical protein